MEKCSHSRNSSRIKVNLVNTGIEESLTSLDASKFVSKASNIDVENLRLITTIFMIVLIGPHK